MGLIWKFPSISDLQEASESYKDKDESNVWQRETRLCGEVWRGNERDRLALW